MSTRTAHPDRHVSARGADVYRLWPHLVLSRLPARVQPSYCRRTACVSVRMPQASAESRGEDMNRMPDHQPDRIRRASLPPEARSFPQRASSSAMTRNTSEDRSITGIPRSTLRHRPIGNLYVIPLTDGTEMHVTERELDDVPAEYQYAARLIEPPLVPT